MLVCLWLPACLAKLSCTILCEINDSQLLVFVFGSLLLGNRNTNFNIGLMDTQPGGNGASVGVDDYQLCYHHGVQIFNELEAWCQPEPVIGRYLIIQLQSSWSSMTLCEVQVFGMCKLLTWIFM